MLFPVMDVKEAYLKAGEIASKVLSRGLKYIEEEASVLEICEKVEEEIKGFGGEIAFPCNISQNEEAAHYTAAPEDRKVIEKGSVVKLDIGVHVDGYIADTAATVVLSSKWERMMEAAKSTLMEGLKRIKPELRFSDFGRIVEDFANGLGFRTIENLAGHKLGHYLVHAGESVPNRGGPSTGRFKIGEAYAIEPFLVEKWAKGYVINKGHSNIYRLSTPKKVKDKKLRELVMEIWNRYKSLPFASRWIYSEFGANGLDGLSELAKMGVIHEYPILVEVDGAPVAQFEHTVYIDQDGAVLITTLGKPAQNR